MSYTLVELAQLTDAKLIGDSEHIIAGVDDLDSAMETDASFLENPRYEKRLHSSSAGVIFIQPHIAQKEGQNYLVTNSPSLAFQKVVELFIPEVVSEFTGIHPTAVVSKEAQLGEGVTVGPHASIDRGAVVGKGTRIGPGVSIGPEVTIGEECRLYANAVVRERCQLGNRVILQPGVVIGSCGYGYFSDKTGVHHSLKQLGIVILEDDVDIGANTTVDRARFKTTRIRKGTKVDNLVQIGHQVDLGEHNLIVAQTGIAGSSKTGRNVIMAGQVGVTGHLTITDNVILTARTAVIKSLDKPGVYTGVPATPMREYSQQLVHMRNLSKIVARIKKLEEKWATDAPVSSSESA